jgi:hypothetical protein
MKQMERPPMGHVCPNHHRAFASSRKMPTSAAFLPGPRLDRIVEMGHLLATPSHRGGCAYP